MYEYIYVLPHKIRKFKDFENQEEVLTQRTSFIIHSSFIFDIVKEILSKSDNRKLSEVKKEFNEKVNNNKFTEIINFLVDHDLIYISDRQLTDQEVNFIQFLSQYTKSLKKYIEKMSERTFYIYSDGENIEELVNKIKGFGLNYKLLNSGNIELVTENDIILASIASSDMEHLDIIAKKIENMKDSLFAFTLNYDDSYLISPILNKKNFVDYYSLKRQLNIDNLKNKGLSKNKLVQDMAVSQLVLEVLTSIMKLNIETSYDKAVMFNSIKKSMKINKVYYYPDNSIFKTKYLSLKRWDDEND